MNAHTRKTSLTRGNKIEWSRSSGYLDSGRVSFFHLIDSGSSSKMTSRANGPLGKLIRISTSFPGFSLFLRESTLIAAGHVNPQNLGANKNLPQGRGCKIMKLSLLWERHKIRCWACRLEALLWSISVTRTSLWPRFFLLYTCFCPENGSSRCWLAESKVYVENFRFFFVVA